jgi:hypothetical protein
MPLTDAEGPDSLGALELESLVEVSEVADTTAPSPPVDPTDRLGNQALFEAQGSPNEDPFEGDTLPLFDLEGIDEGSAVADL